MSTTSTTTSRGPARTASTGIIRAMLERAAAHGYGPQARHAATVVGIYADPAATTAMKFEHAGVPAQVVPCRSALAIREALLGHDQSSWLVIITDRPEEDLGAGLLSHFVGHALRTPDPWNAVRQRFAATGIEAALYADQPQATEVAHGLLAALPASGWSPAPAGVLTRDHALGTVARQLLGVSATSLDAYAVLAWSSQHDAATRLAELRHTGKDALADATIDWLAERGAAAEVVSALVRRGEVADVLPLGLALGVLTEQGADDHTTEASLVRLEQRWAPEEPPRVPLEMLAATAQQVVVDLLEDRHNHQRAHQVLARADAILMEVHAASLSKRSDLLPSGLEARLHELADQLRGHEHGTADLAAIEAAWARVTAHRLAFIDKGEVLRAYEAAVRLSRWLAPAPEPGGATLADLARRQNHVDAWVDSAVNDAAAGVADPELAAGLHAVLGQVQRHRDEHDQAFAEALAAATAADLGVGDGHLPGEEDRVWLLEHVLPKVVFPIAHDAPTLLLILDGMSASVATEIVDHITGRGDGWNEALLPHTTRRGTALAALPSLTEVSRTSLLTGQLQVGDQSTERRGYKDLTDAHRLPRAEIFHKKPLDTSRPGFALADDVAAAIGATEKIALVTCVLNTIDDALDRSDPAGTTWTTDAVKHLRPLLDRALAVGRTVIITADHGHVVERRDGQQRKQDDPSSSRSRAAKPAAGDAEVTITGRRVLKHDGSAVLPWNERLRYGQLKAGYHGGASPAEVVVPLVLLVPGDPAAELAVELAPPQSPVWWTQPLVGTVDVAGAETVRAAKATSARSQEGPDLFGDTFPGFTPTAAKAESSAGAAVVASDAFTEQRKVAGRITLSDDQVRAVVEALAHAPGYRLAATPLATALGVPESRLRGGIAQLQKLLNVEGYGVLRTEGPVVILDTLLLDEQFGLGT